MSPQTPFTRPVRTIVNLFLALCAVAILVAVAERAGILDSFAEKRGLGLIIGLMAVAVGNFLPKLRPLQQSFANVAHGMAAERFAGWTLVLTGLAFIALFALLPLKQARSVSAIIGIGAILTIAARWVGFAPSTVPRPQQSAETTVAMGRRSAEKRRLAALLSAFFCLFGTACAAFLLSKESWWMTTGFLLSYPAIIGFRPRSACNREATR